MRRDEDKTSVVVYTDPLCCWSWQFEPVLDRIKEEMDTLFEWRYCMVGLIPGWQQFWDERQAVSRPQQMGPVWMHASVLCGRKINYNIWHTDPPASSMPPAAAFKCAQKQAASTGDLYLKKLWSAVMEKELNISKDDVLFSLAAEQAEEIQLNLAQFKTDYLSGAGNKLLHTDMLDVRVKQIKRLPALVISPPGKRSILVEGYRSYDAIKSILNTVTNEPFPKKQSS